MADTTPGVLGAFVHIDAATDAIRALKAQGHADLTVYSAAPNHEIEEALEHTVSPVRLFTSAISARFSLAWVCTRQPR